MIEVTERASVSAEDIFNVLADGWKYASWVVGTAHIRAVDHDWPRPGSRIHHSVGPWPLQGKDISRVKEMEWGRLLELEARLWPIGSATVRITLEPEDGGTLIHLAEAVTGGPLARIPHAVQKLFIAPRNRESLSRLIDLAQGRT